jgi:protein TonB
MPKRTSAPVSRAPLVPVPTPVPVAFEPAPAPSHAPAPIWQPSRYEASSRPRGLALIGSALAVGGMVAALLSVGVIGAKPRHETFTAVRLSTELAPPPPRQKAAPQPAHMPRQAAAPVVAPTPAITLPTTPTVAAARWQRRSRFPFPQRPRQRPSPRRRLLPRPPLRQPPRWPRAGICVQPPRSDPAALSDRSRRAREQGTVVLKVTVGLDGRVAQIDVSRSSGFDRLDRAALGAVRHWRWSVTRQNGAAMMVQGLVSIPFVLQG